jgi:hypothetical protein
MGLSVSGAIKARLTNRSRRHFKIKLKLTKRKSFHPLNILNRAFSPNSRRIVKRQIFRINPLKIGMKANSVLAIALIVVMMVSVFAWLSVGTQSKPIIVQPVVNDPTATPDPSQQTTNPTPTTNPTKTPDINTIFRNIVTSVTDPIIATKPPGLIESNQNLTATVWQTIASNAWQYFQPDNGVDRNTGLPKASLGFPYFTDWDLGAYIQAIIDANKTGLIGNDGDWGSNARINKVLTFLETRELNNASYPYWFYQASDGKNYHASSDLATSNIDVVDTGRLFVALNNLKTFNNSLAARINNLTISGRSNYATIIPSLITSESGANSVYDYYFMSGFASFFPQLANLPNLILNNMLNSTVTTPEGISLPKAAISCEPLLCSVFELANNSQINALSKQVYLAHEARYNATGQYVAFSEGDSSKGFIYEWVETPYGDMWKVMNNGENTYSNMNPIIFTKVSISFLSLYNTAFARNMAIYLEKSLPASTSGYYSGADFNADPNSANQVQSIDSNTNSMILDAANYALKNNA